MLPTYLKDCTGHLQEFFLINAPLWQALRGCGTSRFTHLWYDRRMVTVPIVFQLHCQLQDYCPESPSARCQCGLLQGGVSSLTCMAGLTSQLKHTWKTNAGKSSQLRWRWSWLCRVKHSSGRWLWWWITLLLGYSSHHDQPPPEEAPSRKLFSLERIKAYGSSSGKCVSLPKMPIIGKSLWFCLLWF